MKFFLCVVFACLFFLFFWIEVQLIQNDLTFNRQIMCGSLGLSTATVKLINTDGQEHIACSVGTGPVDAAYKAVDLIVKV